MTARSSVFERLSLRGRKALVTGGSKGLGREMALGLADAGADLVLVAREREGLEATAREVRALGADVAVHEGDASDPQAWEAACEHILASDGPVDVLVNNIGGRRYDIPTAEVSLARWREIIDLNLTSTVLATRVFGRAMIDRGRGGRIINVASISGIIVNRGIGGRAYETGKAAVIQFTRATAADWAVHRITVNAICPGGFMTEPNQRWAREQPEVIDTLRAQVPAGELGDPSDLGPLAVYLASDAARYVTGASIVIDGGYTVW